MTVTGRVKGLLETHHNSNYILLQIPIEIQRLEHGQRLICMDSERLTEELALTDQEIESLLQAGLVRRRPQKLRPKGKVDYGALQPTYTSMLTEGPSSNQTELARQLGVSRVWVSRVLRGIKEKDGRECPRRSVVSCGRPS